MGYLFDTDSTTLNVTPERLVEIGQLLHAWVEKEMASMKDVERLVGKLKFVAKCVRPGRIFISRLLETLGYFPGEGKYTLSKEFKKDIRW